MHLAPRSGRLPPAAWRTGLRDTSMQHAPMAPNAPAASFAASPRCHQGFAFPKVRTIMMMAIIVRKPLAGPGANPPARAHPTASPPHMCTLDPASACACACALAVPPSSAPQGEVLHQNAGSVAYFGYRRRKAVAGPQPAAHLGERQQQQAAAVHRYHHHHHHQPSKAEAATPGPPPLQQLFGLAAPDSLSDCFEAVVQGGVWKGASWPAGWSGREARACGRARAGQRAPIGPCASQASGGRQGGICKALLACSVREFLAFIAAA